MNFDVNEYSKGDDCEVNVGDNKKPEQCVEKRAENETAVAPAPEHEPAVSSDDTAALRRQVAELQAQLKQSQLTSFNLSSALKATGELCKRLTIGQDAQEGGTIKKDGEQDNDSYYFDSYSDFSIHETMLRDDVRHYHASIKPVSSNLIYSIASNAS